MKNFKLPRPTIVIAEIVAFLTSLFLIFWIYNDNTTILGSYLDPDRYGRDLEMSWIHQVLGILVILYLAFTLVIIIWEIVVAVDEDYCAEDESPLRAITSFLDDEDNYEHRHRSEEQIKRDEENAEKQKEIIDNIKNKTKMNLRKTIKWAIFIFLAVVLFKFGRTVTTQSIDMFNTSKTYNYSYDQKVEEKEGFYDKLWKTYDQKDAIVELNKETFIEVTKIIMENRKAGENVTWNWVRENQHIPYSEFSKFYANLSDYITSQREGYFAIEKQCQHIARQHNTMIDTFPNNVYNRMLKLEAIEYEYGFLSDSTRNVFATQTENLK